MHHAFRKNKVYIRYIRRFSQDVATFLFIVLAGSAVMVYSWAPWWVQFYEYAGKLVVTDVLDPF